MQFCQLMQYEGASLDLSSCLQCQVPSVARMSSSIPIHATGSAACYACGPVDRVNGLPAALRAVGARHRLGSGEAYILGRIAIRVLTGAF